MEKYREILERMQGAYREKSGWEPETVSDLGLRLQVLAGELCRLHARLDWLQAQAFPQTAVGKQLDLHGGQRGIVRRGGEKAQGLLTFSRYLPISFDILIPKGTVCASYGEEAVEYETTEDGILAAGQVKAEVPAQAVVGGSRGNAAASYINTLVSEVNGVNYVVNTQPFTGGKDPEDDQAYRSRILEAFGKIENCGNSYYYQRLALEQEGVTSAQTVAREDGPGTVTVYVWGQGEALGEEALEALSSRLNQLREVGVTVSVKSAASKKINIMASLKMRPGASFAQAKERAEAALSAWFASLKIGQPVYLGDLSRVLLEDPAVAKVVFSSTADTETPPGTMPVLGMAVLSEST